jgi:hypothetical protein
VRINEEPLEIKVAAPIKKTEINDRRGSAALTTRHPSIHKSWHLISSISGSRSVGIVRLRTKGHGVYLYVSWRVDGLKQLILRCMKSRTLQSTTALTNSPQSAVSLIASLLTFLPTGHCSTTKFLQFCLRSQDSWLCFCQASPRTAQKAPLPTFGFIFSNGIVCCLHSSFFEEICHNVVIFRRMFLINIYHFYMRHCSLCYAYIW